MDRRTFTLTAGAALGCVAGGLAYRTARARPDPFRGYTGVVAPSAPEQHALDTPVRVRTAGGDLTLFATFSLTALVLSSRTYAKDTLAAVSPIDLALGWGPSSNPDVIRNITYWQNDRWYVYRSADPISTEVRQSSSNMHIIPETAEVLSTVAAMKIGNLITLTGHLCDIEMPGHPLIRSSRSRTDRDGGACEIVYVSRAEILA